MPAGDGSIVFPVDMNVSEAERKLADLKKKIEKVSQEASKGETKKSSLEQQIESTISKISALKKQIDDIQNRPLDWDADWGTAMERQQAEIAPLQQEVSAYEKELEKALGAMEKNDQAISGAKKEFERLNSEAAELQQTIQQTEASGGGFSEDSTRNIGEALESAKKSIASVSTSISKGIGGAFTKVEKSARRFARRLLNLAASALIFSAMTKALTSLREKIFDVITSNEQAANALAQLKAAANVALQPLIDALLPKLIALFQFLTNVLVSAGKAIASFFGVSYEKSIESAKAMEQQKDSTEDAAKAAKKAQQTLAGFDTIQTINTSEESSTSSGAGTGGGATADYAALVEEGLSPVEKVLSGMALIALGLVVSLFGHMAIGMAMVVAGAKMVYDELQKDPAAISNALGGIRNEAITGMLLMALGVLVIMFGRLLIGIAMVAAGAYTVYDALQQDPAAISDALGGVHAELLDGMLLIALGVLVAICGHRLIGIAMVIAGAYLVYDAATQDPDALTTALQDTATGLGVMIAGMLLIALGVFVMTAGKKDFLLGLAMVVAGAYGVYKAVAANWGTIAEQLQGPIGIITAILSAASLAIGAILLFSGVATGLGLSLLAMGAVGLATVIAANWDWIVDKIKGIAEAIKNVFNTLWNFIKNIINKILGGIESFVNFFVKSLNFIIDGINKISFKLPDWLPGDLGGKTLGFNIPRINDFSLPRLAQGGLIPPNREFLAMLGDNTAEEEIVSPISAMKQAVKEALEEAGGVGGDIHITLTLDGRVVAQNTVKHINQMNRANGRPVIVG